MNLVKWFRKNKTKVMAIVVVIIMFGFVGGSALSYLLSPKRTGQHNTVAYFGDNRKITEKDLYDARRELGILKRLGVDELLRSIGVPLSDTQDLQALLLGELLFSERKISPALTKHIKQLIRTNGYRISDKQINDIYRRPMPSDIYWLLLKNEAQLAGIRVSNEDSGKLLARIMPQIPQFTKEMQTTFGKLLAVLEYARLTCSGQDVTTAQIMHNASRENETIDAEFVRFDSAVFAKTQSEPNEEKISAHFDKYKKSFADAVSKENPYGFGYKLPDRVRLEYNAVKLDDVSKIVTAPTQEEAEEYYQRHREQFTTSVPSDPNDPNSPTIEQTKSYPEVASIISRQLLQNKINSKAEQILQEAKALTEPDFKDIEDANLSTEQLRKMAGDYKTAAEQLSEKYKIKVYAGQTGLLSAVDMQVDQYLGMLYLKGYGYGYNPVGLTQIVFAIDELQASELGPFDVPKPRMYENIGPARDIRTQIQGFTGTNMVVVRVINAQKASEPESINLTYSKSTLKLEQDKDQASKDVYSVKENVVEDLKKLAAMDTTKSKAEEFISLATKDGWESAIQKFNELYRQQTKQDESDPNVVKLQNFTNISRTSRMALETWAVQNAGNPAAQLLINERKNNNRLIDQLFSLALQDSNSIDTVPLEFKPAMSYYCLKNISVKRLEQEQYETIKAIQIYREEHIQSQSLAAVHFNPENISKRMSFRGAKEEKAVADANTPKDTEGAS
ncbi:MAG: hypothetical protein ACYS30_12025 [Planctomycetota bacterium]|jgi:uncharacterized protein YneF (UPF0154 family)